MVGRLLATSSAMGADQAWVPARFVIEALGLALSWDAASRDAKCSEPMECIFKDGKASFINRFGEAAVASNFEAAGIS